MVQLVVPHTLQREPGSSPLALLLLGLLGHRDGEGLLLARGRLLVEQSPRDKMVKISQSNINIAMP